MNQLKQQRHGHWLFFSLLGLLLSLCFVRYALQVNIPQEVLLAVGLLIMLLGDRDEIAALCICMIPLDTSVNYAYVLLFGLLIYVLKFGRTIRFNLTIVPVLLMLLWELLHCFGFPFSPVTYLRNCITILLLALLMCAGNKRFDYDFIVRALSISVAAMCLCLLGRLLYAANFNLSAAISGMRRLGLDTGETTLAITGGQQNPNTLGIQCVLAVTGLMQLRNSGRSKPGDSGLMLFLLVFGALTSSRTYLACLAIMAVLLVFSQKGSLSGKLKFMGSILLAILAAVLLLALLFPDLLEYYYSRFFVEDISTGRTDLMAIYHEFIMSEPRVLFFGIGLQNFVQKVLEVYRVTTLVPHNGIQELVVAWGIPGVMLFALLWLTMILRSRQLVKNQTLLHFIPFLILLAKIQVGQMLNSAYTMLAFSYAYLSLSADIAPGAAMGRPRRKSGNR